MTPRRHPWALQPLPRQTHSCRECRPGAQRRALTREALFVAAIAFACSLIPRRTPFPPFTPAVHRILACAHPTAELRLDPVNRFCTGQSFLGVSGELVRQVDFPPFTRLLRILHSETPAFSIPQIRQCPIWGVSAIAPQYLVVLYLTRTRAGGTFNCTPGFW